MMDRKNFLQLITVGGLGSAVNVGNTLSGEYSSIIKPKALRKGDTIGLISPGMILPEAGRYDQIIDEIHQLGYKTKEAPNARNQYGYLAGTDQERASDLNAMFEDDSVDAIMPFRGGWGCNRLLPLIDFNTIRSNPKILVGYSDITTLLLSIYAQTGLVTFHGPVGKSKWTDYTFEHFHNMLHGANEYNLTSAQNGHQDIYDSAKVIRPGKATGRLLGGNLSVLTAMMGSEYLPNWENCILFIEDVGEAVYRIDRMLTQLKLNGVLDKISGFILGQCNSCDPSNSYSLSLQQVLDDHIKPLGIPAFTGAMFGHIDDMVTLPVGLLASIDAESGAITIAEPAVQGQG